MTLQDDIAELHGRRLEPAARYAAVAKIINDAERRRVLKVGDDAPTFTLSDPRRGPLTSSELLARGPIVITFYRGLWCPYCRQDLLELEAAMPIFRESSSEIVAICNDLGEGTKIADKLGFPLLEDNHGHVAERFGVRWPPEEAELIDAEIGGDLVTLHNAGPWISPMQARFVVGQDGRVVFAEAAFTYEQRSAPSALVPLLTRLAR